MAPRRGETSFFSKMHVATQMSPRWLQDGPRASQEGLKRRFFVPKRGEGVIGPPLFWPMASGDGIKMAQDGRKMAPDGLKMALKRPFRGQRCPDFDSARAGGDARSVIISKSKNGHEWGRRAADLADLL